MVEISSKESENKLRDIHQKLLLITVCCATIAAWVIFIINPWFIELWVGDVFFAGKTILALALVIMLQLTILHVSAVCLYGVGSIKGISIVSLIEAALNLILTLWLGKIFGIKGILIATIAASWLTAMWYVPWSTLKHLKIGLKDYLFKPLLVPFFIISGLGLSLYFLTVDLFRMIPLNWFNFFVATIIIGVLFAAFAWVVFLKKYFLQYVPLRFKKYLSII
jgi:O-antigen/teichoic acid export membrane protein